MRRKMLPMSRNEAYQFGSAVLAPDTSGANTMNNGLSALQLCFVHTAEHMEEVL
jgi:hypothetical protein